MDKRIVEIATKFFEKKGITSIGISSDKIVAIGDIKELSCEITFFEHYGKLGFCRIERQFLGVQFEFPLDAPLNKIEEKFDEEFATHYLDNREFPCEECEDGEMIQDGFVQPNGVVYYECNKCGNRVSFP